MVKCCKGPRGPPGIPGGSLLPENTLYVATEWFGEDIDPLINFTDLQDAIDQAEVIRDDTSNPVVVYIYPGTYTGNITLHPGVVLNGISKAYIIGNITITSASPSTWVVGIINIVTQIIAHTGDGLSELTLRNVTCSNVTETNVSTDQVHRYDNVSGSSLTKSVASTNIFNNVSFLTTTLGAKTGSRHTNCYFRDTFSFPSGITAVVNFTNTYIFGATALSSAASTYNFSNSKFVGTITNAGTLDIRGCVHNTLAGAGTVKRTFERYGIQSVDNTDTNMVIAPPFPDTNYFVTVSQVSGVGSLFQINDKAATDFDAINDGGTMNFDMILQYIST